MKRARQIAAAIHGSVAALLAAATLACGNSTDGSSVPTAPAAPLVLDRTSVVDALEYWASAVGIRYELISESVEPRLLIRAGTDGLASQGGGRGLIDGVYVEDNQARSGLVVFEPGGGQYCRLSAAWCRYLYRHEIGHALGFLGHSDVGLMRGTPDELTDRERRMMLSLYALPHGARVQPNGHWSVPATGASGLLTDLQTAQDIIDWNMNAQGGSSFRELGIIVRWEPPVRVYLR